MSTFGKLYLLLVCILPFVSSKKSHPKHHGKQSEGLLSELGLGDAALSFGLYRLWQYTKADTIPEPTLADVLERDSEVQNLLQGVTQLGALPPHNDKLLPGTLEKFLMPASHLRVHYESETSSGEKVRCFPSSSLETGCLPYFLHLPDGKADVPYLWVYFHPNAEDIGCNSSVVVANHIAEMGHATVVVEYPGYGQAGGETVISVIDSAVHEAIQHILTVWKVPSERIIFLAYSIGTGISATLAARLAAEGHAIGGIGLIAPYASVRSISELTAANTLPMFAKLGGYVPNDFWNTAQSLRQLQCPMWLSYASGDGVIPASQARLVISAVENAERLMTRSFADEELLPVDVLSMIKSPHPIFHELVLEPTLSDLAFHRWTQRVAVETSMISLAVSKDDKPLLPIHRSGDGLTCKNVDIDGLTSIFKSLYYDRLYAEQTDEQWRGMMEDFAWHTIVG